jgi:NADH-quinone oxidoreductase subunit L
MTMLADMLAAITSPHTGGNVSQGAGLMMLVPALTLLGVVLCTLCAIFRVKNKLPAWISVGCLAGSFVAVAATYAGFDGGAKIAHGFEWITFHWSDAPAAGGKVSFVANFSFYIDSLTLLWMLFVTGLATLIALYASEYMSHDVGTGYCRFFVAFCLFVFSMACLVMGDNMLLLYLGWEGVGLCSYLLIGYFYKKPSAVAAAKKAFIMNRIGDLGLALGIMLTFVHFGSIEYTVIFEKAKPYLAAMSEGRYGDIPTMAKVIPLLLMVGAFGKSAQLPLYVWLPDAMEGPTPVSALIHAATMVTAGVYLIARTYPLFLLSEWALPIVAWVGTLTAFLAATIGMAQFDIKRIMAYSTVSQLGYMFAGLGVLASTGAAFHVFTHAFFKAMLFLSCGAVMHGFAGQLDLRKLSGVAFMKGWWVVGIAMFVGCLNLAGFPFTAGYFSKDMILAEAFTTPGMAGIGWVLLLTAGLTAYYTFRVFFRVFVGPKYYEPGDEVHAHADHNHDGHGHGEHAGDHAGGHGGGHGGGHEFHPHAPGWAINSVLAILTVATIAAAGAYFLKPADGGHGGWVGGMVHSSSAAFESPFAHHGAEGGANGGAGQAAGHTGGLPSAFRTGEAGHGGTFLGWDPHKVMYYVSAVVGAVGILAAFVLHYAGRTTAARSRADGLLPMVGGVSRLAQRKWLVDELYDALVRKPLWVLSNVFHLIDKLVVDGLVDLAGFIPRAVGGSIRPAQSGVLHGYALGMAGGLALFLVIVLLVTFA